MNRFVMLAESVVGTSHNETDGQLLMAKGMDEWFAAGRVDGILIERPADEVLTAGQTDGLCTAGQTDKVLTADQTDRQLGLLNMV